MSLWNKKRRLKTWKPVFRRRFCWRLNHLFCHCRAGGKDGIRRQQAVMLAASCSVGFAHEKKQLGYGSVCGLIDRFHGRSPRYGLAVDLFYSALNFSRPIKRFQKIGQFGKAVEYGEMRGGVQHGGRVCACGEGDGGGFGVGCHFQVVGRIADN